MAIDTGIARGADQQAIVVARTVGGIISYTRWPTERPVLRLCVAGSARYAGQLGDVSKSAGRPVSVRILQPGAATTDCDALYLGAMPADRSGPMIAGLANRAVLSVTEADPNCRSGAMFCLEVRPASLSFRVSIDAISRTTLRVDPRVLRIAGGEAL